MGTNFYLITKNKDAAQNYAPYSYELTDNPYFGYKIHVAKTSMGWLPLFQAHTDGIKSIKEYKKAYSTGLFEIIDEYGDAYNWEEFDERVLQFNGGTRKNCKMSKVEDIAKDFFDDKSMPNYIPISHTPGNAQSYKYRYIEEYTGYEDEDGYEFEERWFG